MFKLPFRKYYYGDGTSNVLLLHDKMAAAVNKLLSSTANVAGSATDATTTSTDTDDIKVDTGNL